MGVLRSMTGYGEAVAENESFKIKAAAKAVNQRYFDITLHAPVQLAPLEVKLRQAVKARVARGKLDLFLTLTFDATRWRDIDAKRFDTARVRFDKFMRVVETQCPNCWFVWSIEVSDIGALHYHLVGSLGDGHGLSKAKSFAGRWLYLTGSKNPDMFDAKAADMSVLGYLFQPQKNQFKLNTRRFPRKRLFGIRGKKNITFGKISKVREITAEERTEIIELIARKMYAGRDTAGLWEYAQREVTPFAFCTEEVVNEVKALVKKRKK